jgi:hypothetical protein
MVEMSQIFEIAEPSICPELQYQRQLFPIEIIDLYPNDQNSADLQLIGTGRNGKDYAIKRTSDSSKGMIPAAELFCYELARKVNIATPEFDLLLLQDGELAFGSVWEGGVHKISGYNTIASLLTESSIGDIKVKSLERFFSRVYGFDLFINNIDRHFGNFMFRQSYNNAYIALAFDYSRAWYEIDYAGLQALRDKTCNTQQVIKSIKTYHKFYQQQANDTISELGQISRETIGQILSET